ncbi:MAG: enoyl-CoA hydratase/isomerase family protein [Acidimicrobiia bacterium]|nr:enoyl-CoA hydratase/isomerase family protein [Acidimicrobiia bacterium]MDH5616179.1 enoyl-CoA hydratase/isomerase family protein [Acidimicrobiia bacterium]
MIDSSSYDLLRFAYPSDGIVEVIIENPPVNSVGAQGHGELTRVWLDVDKDEAIRVAVLRAEGRAFSAGGDFALLESMVADPVESARVMREAGDLVRNIVECSKPIVSAINGAAVGAGLAAALLADIPVAGRSARILDGHVKLGVAAGDHAVVLWPLLVGMAKAKYYLLTNEPLTGEEAERIGLVAKVVDDDDLYDTTLGIARSLAAGSRTAISWTKQALNHWLRAAYPAFDASLALEFLGFRGPDAAEGLAALKEKRSPHF